MGPRGRSPTEQFRSLSFRPTHCHLPRAGHPQSTPGAPGATGESCLAALSCRRQPTCYTSPPHAVPSSVPPANGLFPERQSHFSYLWSLCLPTRLGAFELQHPEHMAVCALRAAGVQRPEVSGSSLLQSLVDVWGTQPFSRPPPCPLPRGPSYSSG